MNLLLYGGDDDGAESVPIIEVRDSPAGHGGIFYDAVSANPPEPGVIAGEIGEDLRAALEQFAAIGEDLARVPVNTIPGRS